MAEIVPIEYHEAVALTEYLELLKTQRKIALFTHVSNETYVKSYMVRKMHKLQGLRAGFPDYVIVLKDKILFLELKRIKRSVVSPEQEMWRKALLQAGSKAVVCFGFAEAKRFIEENL